MNFTDILLLRYVIVWWCNFFVLELAWFNFLGFELVWYNVLTLGLFGKNVSTLGLFGQKFMSLSLFVSMLIALTLFDLWTESYCTRYLCSVFLPFRYNTSVCRRTNAKPKEDCWNHCAAYKLPNTGADDSRKIKQSYNSL